MARIFISYSRTDEPFARRLAADLDGLGADVWIDVDDIPAGMKWSTAIQQGLNQCDVMIVLISPDSMASRNVEDEWQFYLDHDKPLIPVLWRPTAIHFQLSRIQYVNFHEMEYAAAFKALCTELQRKGIALNSPNPRPAAPTPPADPLPPDVFDLIPEYYRAFEAGDLDRAGQVLDRIRASDHVPSIFNVEQAARRLENEQVRAAREPEMVRAYQILLFQEKYELLEQVRTSLRAFWKDYPDFKSYDPEGLVARVFPPVTAILPPPFEWVTIPAGQVTLITEKDWHENYIPKGESQVFDVPTFAIARYPVTNAQYQAFLDVADGYPNSRWWDYSEPARSWRAKHPKPEATAFPGDDLPRTNINWYDSVAFCRWLSHRTGQAITLPTEQQWQRAAQGDDGRTYPWGEDEPNERLCNFGRNVGRTTPVTQYPKGASPYGVMDMAGNVWEWCLTVYETGSTALDGDAARVLRGGSWDFSVRLARAAFRSNYYPHYRNLDRGFRVVCALPL